MTNPNPNPNPRTGLVDREWAAVGGDLSELYAGAIRDQAEGQEQVVFHAQLSLMTGHPVDPTRLEPWETYEALLDRRRTASQVRDLHLLWLGAYRERCRDEAGRRHVPAVSTAMAELWADTPAAFVALLRLLASRSGVSRRQLALRSPREKPGRLPVSQVYSMLGRAAALPRSGPQVRSFAEACGLGDPQIQRLLCVWVALRHAVGDPTSHPIGAGEIGDADPGRTAPEGTPPAGRESAVPAGMRAVVERWLAEYEDRHRYRQHWAPHESTMRLATDPVT